MIDRIPQCYEDYPMLNTTLPNQDKFQFSLSLIESSMKKHETIEKTEYRHGGVLESSTNDFTASANIEFTNKDQSLGKHVIHVAGQFYCSSFDTSCSQGSMVHKLESPTLDINQLSEQERLNFFHELGVSIYFEDQF